ncbi:MAG TPA: type IV pilus assembly protein PilM [Candidatus Paceibacterota bacterium]|nr:type IV pilus assembly protein PilM [Candidatus Paceibacterota bacterium]
MPNPFNFIRQQLSPVYLGVDIGTTSIKIVEVEQGQQGPRVTNYALLESQSSLTRANTVFQTSTLKLFDQEIGQFLKLAISKMHPKTNEAVASLAGFSAFTTILNFPKMSDEDLQKSMAFQVKQYIPLPLSEVALDWLKVGEYTDDKGFTYQQILLISVPQEQVRKYQKIFTAAGLALRALEIESLSLVRSLIGTDPTSTLIVDIGSRSTAIIVAREGQLKFTTQSDFAGASLTQAVAESLNINPLRAEELKRERGIIGTGPNRELSTIMVPFLDAILNEVKRAQYNYESQFPGAPKIERMILSGGGANLPGIGKYVSDQFHMPVVTANPFSRCEYPANLEPLVGELNPLLSVALGLAVRDFV